MPLPRLLLAMIAGLLLVGIGPGCSASPPSEGSRPIDDVSRASAEADLSRLCEGKAERIRCRLSASLFTVYAHALGDPAKRAPQLRLMPLAEAGRTLFELAADSEPVEIQRRYAVMRTVVGGLDLRQPGCLSSTALEFLTATRAPIDAIRTQIDLALQRLAPEPPICLRPVPAPSSVPPHLIRPITEELESTILTMDTWAPLSCPFTPLPDPPGAGEVCNGTSEIPAGTVTARSYIEVDRNLDTLRALFDPQSWDDVRECVTYFEQACVVDADNECKSCPPEAGSEWTDRLYERFVVTWDPIFPNTGNTSSLSVYLDVTSEPAINHHRVDYCLDKHAFSRIGNNTSGRIVVDQGYSEISYVTDLKSRIEVVKRIRFEDWTDVSGNPIDESVNYVADVMLKELADSTAKYACCTEPEDQGCLSPLGSPVLLPDRSAVISSAKSRAGVPWARLRTARGEQS